MRYLRVLKVVCVACVRVCVCLYIDACAGARARLFDLHARVYRRRAVSGLTCAYGRASVVFLFVSVAVLVVARVRVCARACKGARVRTACACARVCVCVVA